MLVNRRNCAGSFSDFTCFEKSVLTKMLGLAARVDKFTNCSISGRFLGLKLKLICDLVLVDLTRLCYEPWRFFLNWSIGFFLFLAVDI